ncbi:hypothetical protein PFISCL1PPCAC_20298, partial [Pristionchus fissidentatus]
FQAYSEMAIINCTRYGDKFVTKIRLITERLEQYPNERVSYGIVLIRLSAISSEHVSLFKVMRRIKVEQEFHLDFDGKEVLNTRLSISPLITDSFLLELIKEKKRVHLDLVCLDLTFDGIILAAKALWERSLEQYYDHHGPRASFYVKKSIIPTLDSKTIGKWKHRYQIGSSKFLCTIPSYDPTKIELEEKKFMKVERKKSLYGEDALITLGYYMEEEKKKE